MICRPLRVQLPSARPRLAGVHRQLLPRPARAPAQEQSGDHRAEQEETPRQGSPVQPGQGRRGGRALRLRRVAVRPLALITPQLPLYFYI